jgi:predicted transcriptional regulator
MTTTVRVSDDTHERLVTLAHTTGRRMQSIVEDAVAT